MVEQTMEKAPELDRASINAVNLSEPNSSQDLPPTDDFGRIGTQPGDTEMQRLDIQRDNSPPSTQTQIHHEIEANASSDRTVRYSDALPWKGPLE